MKFSFISYVRKINENSEEKIEKKKIYYAYFILYIKNKYYILIIK